MNTLRFAAALAAVSFLGCSTDAADLFSDGAGDGGAGGGRPTSAETIATNGPGSTTTGQTATVGQTTVTNGPVTATSTVTTDATTTSGGLIPDLYCNAQPCQAGEICCYFLYEAGQDYCSQSGSCPDENQGWIEISCNGPDDCPNQQCCGAFDGQSWVDVSCHSNCSSDSQNEMCETDNPGTCTMGTCQPSQLLGPGYGYCAN